MLKTCEPNLECMAYRLVYDFNGRSKNLVGMLPNCCFLVPSSDPADGCEATRSVAGSCFDTYKAGDLIVKSLPASGMLAMSLFLAFG